MTNAASAPPNLDPFSVVVIFATSFGMTGDIASILAAYSVILLSALGGAAWSASGSPQMTWGGAFLHIVMMMGLALVATVPLAELVSRVSGVEVRWLLSPLALLIGARPDWVIKTVRRWFSKSSGIADPDLDAKEKQP